MNYLLHALRKYDREKHFFWYPFPHIVIENAVDRDIMDEIERVGLQSDRVKTLENDIRKDYRISQEPDWDLLIFLLEQFRLPEFNDILQFCEYLDEKQARKGEPDSGVFLKPGANVILTSCHYSEYDNDVLCSQESRNVSLKKKCTALIPHRDQISKIFTSLLYLADEDDYQGGGLDLFHGAVYGNEKNTICKNAEYVSSIEYRPGTLVVFLNGPISIHAVGHREPGPHKRKMMLNVFECNWGGWTKRFFKK